MNFLIEDIKIFINKIYDIIEAQAYDIIKNHDKSKKTLIYYPNQKEIKDSDKYSEVVKGSTFNKTNSFSESDYSSEAVAGMQLNKLKKVKGYEVSLFVNVDSYILVFTFGVIGNMCDGINVGFNVYRNKITDVSEECVINSTKDLNDYELTLYKTIKCGLEKFLVDCGFDETNIGFEDDNS